MTDSTLRRGELNSGRSRCTGPFLWSAVTSGSGPEILCHCLRLPLWSSLVLYPLPSRCCTSFMAITTHPLTMCAQIAELRDSTEEAGSASCCNSSQALAVPSLLCVFWIAADGGHCDSAPLVCRGKTHDSMTASFKPAQATLRLHFQASPALRRVEERLVMSRTEKKQSKCNSRDHMGKRL